MEIDVSPAQLAIIREILDRHVPDREVWAFGSRAVGKARQYSDLDLALIGDMPLPLSVVAALRDDFSQSDLPFKVDIVDWATVSASFRAVVSRDKVVIAAAGRSG